MSTHDSVPPFDTPDGRDVFAPERIDETIAALLAPDAPAEDALELVRALATAHALPAGADDTLRRVRVKLASTSITEWRESQPVRLAPLNPVQTTLPLALGRHPADSHSHLAATLRALAAVLVVGLLAGGFLTVLRLRVGAPTAVAWQNAGITAMRARGGPLDFDPAQGVCVRILQSRGR